MNRYGKISTCILAADKLADLIISTLSTELEV